VQPIEIASNMIKRTHLPRLLLLTVGLTSGVEYYFLPREAEKQQEIIQYIEKSSVPVITRQNKTIRLTPKNAKSVFRQHGLLWCEKVLKKQGCLRISSGDVLTLSLKKEKGLTTVLNAICYTADDFGYKIDATHKVVVRFKLKRTVKSVSNDFKKSFQHTVAAHKLPKEVISEALRSLALATDTKKNLKPGVKVQLVYSTIELPDKTHFNSRLRYVGLTGKVKAEVFVFDHGSAKGCYGADGKLLAHNTLKLPIRNRFAFRDGFGYRKDPFTRERRFHSGLDLSAPRGTPIYAAAGGTIVHCGYQSGYGKIVEIRHTGTMRTRYAHLHQIKVKTGQTIDASTVIGTVGATGRATGPHLHYEVIKNGQHVNPRKFAMLDNIALAGKAMAAFKGFKTQCQSTLRVCTKTV
jgi:murein DD-endopeptidase MepM/ murein hydrolase activator NlpD